MGQPYQGGIIAYIDNSGEHGLIAAPSDQGYEMWYNVTPIINTYATGTEIGTGQSNTTKIVQAYGAGNYAAKLCDDLVLNGYSDWFLPSKDELNELWKNKDLIGGFISSSYWCSSEYDKDHAWWQSFINDINPGRQSTVHKVANCPVRAVRYF